MWHLLDAQEENDFTRSIGEYEQLKFQFSRSMSSQLGTELMDMEIDSVKLLANASTGSKLLVKDSSYLGPHLSDPLTLETIVGLIEHCRLFDDIVTKKKKEESELKMRRTITRFNSTVLHKVALHREYVLFILKRAKEVLSKLPNVVQIAFPESTDGKDDPMITVVGDTHGQLRDLLKILDMKGLPSKNNQYLFNGDFVDRGKYSAEIVLILFAFKILYPDYVHLNRGNHESKDINSRDGFEKECLLKWDAEIFAVFSSVFAALPLAHVIEKKVFVVHAGLAWEDFTIADVNRLDRFHEVPPPDSLMEDLLWSDPSNKPGRHQSDRGSGLFFGPDVVERFLRTNSLAYIIRSHECVDEGYQQMFGGRLYTIFSASNYCDSVENNGAVLSLRKSTFPKAHIKQYYAQSKEKLNKITIPGAPVVATDVICRIADRIMKHHKDLEAFWSTLISGAYISASQWQEGMFKVIKLRIPWLRMINFLPGCNDAFTADKAQVDFRKFLHYYSPYRSLMSGSADVEAEIAKGVEKILDIVFHSRFQLESLFRYFDKDASGSITPIEFKAGVRALASIMAKDLSKPEEISDLVLDQIIKRIDKNHDGEIEYDEFFEMFHGSVQKQILEAAGASGN